MRKAREAAPPPAPSSAASTPLTVNNPVFFPASSSSSTETKSDLDTDSLVSSLLNKPSSAAVTALTEPPRSSTTSAAASVNQTDHANKERAKRFTVVKAGSISIIPIEKVTYEKECQTEADDFQAFMQRGHYDDTNKFDDDDGNGGVSASYPHFLNEPGGGGGGGSSGGKRTSMRFLGHGDPHHDLSNDALLTPGNRNTSSAIKSRRLTAKDISGIMRPSSNAFFDPMGFNMPHTPSGSGRPSRLPYTEEEKAAILSEKPFVDFLEKASLHVERALEFSDAFDFLKDITEDMNKQNSVGEKGVVDMSQAYECDFLKQRPVMDMRWSTLRPDLFLAAYGARTLSAVPTTRLAFALPAATGVDVDDAPGLVCIWSKDLHKRPEFKLTASSPVLTAMFHNQEPQLVLGGCYNGQILLWDMTLSRSLPVQRSSLTGRGHKHPVYAMALTTTNELVSVGIDGMLCHWDVSRLTEPITVSMLVFPAPKKQPSLANEFSAMNILSPSSADNSTNTPLNVCCMAYGHTDNVSHIIIGSGAGQIMKNSLPYKPTEAAILQVIAINLFSLALNDEICNKNRIFFSDGSALRVDHCHPAASSLQ